MSNYDHYAGTQNTYSKSFYSDCAQIHKHKRIMSRENMNKKIWAQIAFANLTLYEKMLFRLPFFATATGIGWSKCRWFTVSAIVSEVNFLFHSLERYYFFCLVISCARKMFVLGNHSCCCRFICIINLGSVFCIQFDNETVKRCRTGARGCISIAIRNDGKKIASNIVREDSNEWNLCTMSETNCCCCCRLDIDMLICGHLFRLNTCCSEKTGANAKTLSIFAFAPVSWRTRKRERKRVKVSEWVSERKEKSPNWHFNYGNIHFYEAKLNF